MVLPVAIEPKIIKKKITFIIQRKTIIPEPAT